MELWIRSQDKHTLIKVDFLYSEIKEFDGGFRIYVMPDEIEIAKYKSKERALEVLDDISKRIKNSYIVEVKPLLKEEDLAKIEKTLNIKYDGDFIIQPQQTEIKPINSNLIYYEMPKE